MIDTLYYFAPCFNCLGWIKRSYDITGIGQHCGDELMDIWDTAHGSAKRR